MLASVVWPGRHMRLSLRALLPVLHQVSAASGSTRLPRAIVADNREVRRNEFLEHLQQAHGNVQATEDVEEMWLRDGRSVQNRHHIQAELGSRRHARRFRRQQADMAAAVAGAVVGVCAIIAVGPLAAVLLSLR